MGFADIFQECSNYVSSSTIVFSSLTAFLGAIWGFIAVSKQLAGFFFQKNTISRLLSFDSFLHI